MNFKLKLKKIIEDINKAIQAIETILRDTEKYRVSKVYKVNNLSNKTKEIY